MYFSFANNAPIFDRSYELESSAVFRHMSAHVTTRIDKGVSIVAFSAICARVHIASGAVLLRAVGIFPKCLIGNGVVIGEGSVLHDEVAI